MALPPFESSGDLPPGIYPATLTDVLVRFGEGSNQRKAVAGRLSRIYGLSSATGHLHRFIIFGSFVTAKPDPRDLDLLLVMDDTFDIDAISAETSVVFKHSEADTQLGASVFWMPRTAALGGEQAMIECWQVRRDGGLRGIVEIERNGK